jgi:hypothetical protein
MPEKTTFIKIRHEKVLGKTGKSWREWFRILGGLDLATNGHRHRAMTLYHNY